MTARPSRTATALLSAVMALASARSTCARRSAAVYAAAAFAPRSAPGRRRAQTSGAASSSTSLRAYASKAEKAAIAKEPVMGGELDWEKFDYSDSPKLDKRFNDEANLSAMGTVDLDEWSKTEAEEDKAERRRLDDLNEAYRALDPDVVSRATDILRPFVGDDRYERIDSVLRQRTKRTKFLFENPSNPSNVWACLRTIDSFGVQNVDLVVDSGMYKGKMAVQQKRGMRTAMGSAKWLSLRNHPSTEEAVRAIKAEGYKIYASDLNPNSQDVREVDWDVGPVCVVMGNEERGISDEMREMADVTFTLPMVGFAESFNLSVATSITLAHMSAKSKDGRGALRPGDLDPHELACLRLKGLLGSLPKRKLGPILLKQEGIVLPEIFRLL